MSFVQMTFGTFRRLYQLLEPDFIKVRGGSDRGGRELVNRAMGDTKELLLLLSRYLNTIN